MNFEILNKQRVYELLLKRFNNRFLTLKDLPHPSSFKDMQKGILRVVEAIKKNQKIVLIGDYDVDGVVATTIIRELFKTINYPLEWIIPNRFSDGYGISKKIIDKIDCNLIITVDNGIAAIDAANECKRRKIDLIITDHHNIGEEIPKAYAIINQKQSDCGFEYKEICGAQIAWYFAIALAKELNVKLDSKKLLALTSLAIVADIMPLIDINRVMLIAGLQVLNRSDFAFVKALRDSGFSNITSETIAYYIAPLINSAGRLRDASIASEFLFTNDLNKAKEILEELKAYNSERKNIEAKLTKEAIKQVKSSDKIAIVSGSDWNEGVVGIVASRVSELFKMPAIALSCKDGICKGSGRSFGDCDLFKLVSSAKNYFLKFGGHKSAIGLSFKQENLPLIKSLLNLQTKNICPEIKEVDNSILGILPFIEIDLELINLIERFEPFGEANLKPKFIAKDVEILDIKTIGQNGEHKSYFLNDGTKAFRAVEFRSKNSFKIGDRVDIAYSIGKNEYNGNTYINLYIDKLKVVRDSQRATIPSSKTV
jgi:single-stranded-DNA-specific exonuclease